MSQPALDRLLAQFPDAVLSTHAHRGDETAIIHASRLLEVATFLKTDPDLHFDMLVDLTCIDTLGLNPQCAKAIGGTVNPTYSRVPADALAGTITAVPVPPPQSGRFQVVYHLRAMTTGKRLRLKVPLDEGQDGENPEVDSVASLWKSANWAERETWDMFGVKFRGHPDLRRILMYEEFVGHPLRKDYPKEKRQPLVRRDFS